MDSQALRSTPQSVYAVVTESCNGRPVQAAIKTWKNITVLALLCLSLLAIARAGARHARARTIDPFSRSRASTARASFAPTSSPRASARPARAPRPKKLSTRRVRKKLSLRRSPRELRPVLPQVRRRALLLRLLLLPLLQARLRHGGDREAVLLPQGDAATTARARAKGARGHGREERRFRRARRSRGPRAPRAARPRGGAVSARETSRRHRRTCYVRKAAPG